tara:strand:+ start:307 stop:501 length:195 start_codon:yes stop_codon:yes gene_type:complete
MLWGFISNKKEEGEKITYYFFLSSGALNILYKEGEGEKDGTYSGQGLIILFLISFSNKETVIEF